jgi:hypothetical protein
MRTIRLLAAWSTLAIAGSTLVPAHAAESDGVAIAIVYDTSGSMKDEVRDEKGRLAPKYEIANRALINITQRIQTFATNSASGPRNIQAGLFVFHGEGAKPAVEFGPFNASAFQDWARNFSSPNGGTPLGNALSTATRAVLKSGLSRRHVLIITDGNNTLGPSPAEVMPEFKQNGVSFHFVAFDVDAKVFSGVKQHGATVVGAADETQLNRQLEFILQKKILLEDEEPAKQK